MKRRLHACDAGAHQTAPYGLPPDPARSLANLGGRCRRIRAGATLQRDQAHRNSAPARASAPSPRRRRLRRPRAARAMAARAAWRGRSHPGALRCARLQPAPTARRLGRPRRDRDSGSLRILRLRGAALRAGGPKRRRPGVPQVPRAGGLQALGVSELRGAVPARAGARPSRLSVVPLGGRRIRQAAAGCNGAAAEVGAASRSSTLSRQTAPVQQQRSAE